jgi:energy-coupling factor transporter ATP-binding protein EcfA2
VLSIAAGSYDLGQAIISVDSRIIIKPRDIVFIYGRDSVEVVTFLRWISGLLGVQGDLETYRPGDIRPTWVKLSESAKLGVSFNGERLNRTDVTDDAIARAKIAGFIFGEPYEYILGRLVYDEIRYSFAAVMKDCPDVAFLNAYGLQDKLLSETRTLSGGEAHRLNIACVMALQTPIVVMDLSAANLDQDFLSSLGRWMNMDQQDRIFIIYGYFPKDLGLNWASTRALNVSDGGKIEDITNTEFKPTGSTCAGDNLLHRFKRRYDGSALLDIQDLCRPGITAPLSARLHKGQVYRLIGPNGSGKTTIGRLLCRRLPTEQVGGKLLWLSAASGQGKAVMSGQYPSRSLMRSFATLETNLLSRDERASLVHLCYRRQLSALKLASVLWCLSLDADLYFLDEPTAGMQPDHKKLFIEILNRTPEKAIIFSTHDHSMSEIGQEVRMRSSQE